MDLGVKLLPFRCGVFVSVWMEDSAGDFLYVCVVTIVGRL